MTFRNTWKLTALATVVLGCTFAQANQANPLHPAYYSDRTTVVEKPMRAGTVEVATATNPLHPSYFQGTVAATNFAATGLVAKRPERDPLHPSYLHR